MRLHLHLGAHKTATTQFQNVLQCNRQLYSHEAHYVPMDEFRSRVTHAARFMNPWYQDDVAAYLKELACVDASSLIVSEENLIGDAKDLYGTNTLYCNL